MVEEDGFRVRVSLGRYFSDERRRALVWVSPRSSCTVRHLEKRLKTLFGLDGAFCLLKDDLLLPHTENVRILHPDDVVTVTPLSENFNFVSKKEDFSHVEENIDTVTEKEVKKKKRKKQKEINDENASSDDVNLKNNNKKKNDENVSPSSTPERRITKKTSIVDNPKVISAIENIEKLHAELVRSVDNDDDEEMKSKTLTILKDLASTNGNTLPPLISDGRITKRKRLRVRKSKKNNQSMVSSLSDGESTTPHRNNTVVLLNGKINSHLRFQTNDASPTTVLRNKSHSLDEKPRIIQAIQTPKVNSIAQSQPQSSGISQENFITNGHVNGVNETVNGNISRSHPSIEVILKDIDKFPPANVFPKENDIILFKKLKMNDQYTPVLSNYILGQVSNACTDTSFVKFSILDGHSECLAPAGKFDIEESINEETEINEIDLVWNQVINPKFIQS